jgi:hypothetical protein
MPELGDAGSLSARPWRSARVPSSADSGEQLGTRVQQTRTGHSQPVALDLEQAEGGGLLDEASVDAGQEFLQFGEGDVGGDLVRPRAADDVLETEHRL